MPPGTNYQKPIMPDWMKALGDDKKNKPSQKYEWNPAAIKSTI